MGKVQVAIFWHQHQPYYVDPVSRETAMPWVRLHTVKDYYGMALLVREQPAIKLSINLVPSLLKQIEEIHSGEVKDLLLEIARKPTADLNQDEIIRILDDSFMLNWQTMVNPYPRFRELLLQRSYGRRQASDVLSRFAEEDLRDLLVWNNLAWIHPCAVEQDDTLKALMKKGKDFSEDDKSYVLDSHIEIMKQVVPLHKELQDSGQVELTTSPFYHPILPLLCDIRSARETRPHIPLPDTPYDYPEDAAAQVRKGIEYHQKVFGDAPRGMWPSEGSVSREIIPIVASAGIEWLASDEGILEESFGIGLHRDENYHLRDPSVLYRPYRVCEGGQSVKMVFRDHYLSDLIGFQYQRMSAEDAVDDLMHRLHRIASRSGEPPLLVSIILDGENAWEYYSNSGADFLRLMYRRMAEDPQIETVKIGDALQNHSNPKMLPHMKAGSWINHDFYTWAGHPEKNKAWQYLHRTRSFLKGKEQSGTVPDTASIERAWEEFYVAEGSDWFWWYGDDHSSSQDDLFDRLFRQHLKNVYTALGDEPADFLNNAICGTKLHQLYTEPRGLLRVVVDGTRTDYFEWTAAGLYSVEREQGAMHRVSGRLIRNVYYGFDLENLFVRIDPEETEWGTNLAQISIRLLFQLEQPLVLHIDELQSETPRMRLLRGTARKSRSQVLGSVARGQILELACPFDLLGLKQDDDVSFAVTVCRNNTIVQRAPENASFRLRVPSEYFEEIMWRV